MRIVTIEDFTSIKKFLALAKEVYEANKAKGFWGKPRSPEHCLMLVISEIAEAVEAARKEDDEQKVDYDSLLAAGPKAIFERKSEFKDTFDDEMADTVIRCLDYIGYAYVNFGLLESRKTSLRANVRDLDVGLFGEGEHYGYYQEPDEGEEFWGIDTSDIVKLCYELTQRLFFDGKDEVEKVNSAAISCTDVIACIVWWYGHPSYFTKAITTKLAYNAQRPRLHGKAF